MEIKSKRGSVTEENRDEARKLRAIWDREHDRLKEEGHGTQEKFGDHFHIGNQAAVGFFLGGKTALSVKAAAGFARGLHCKVSDFSPRLAKLMMEPHDAEPSTRGTSFDAPLIARQFGALLAAAPAKNRAELAELLVVFARSGGAERYLSALVDLLLGESDKDSTKIASRQGKRRAA